jgi:hypothetical protein
MNSLNIFHQNIRGVRSKSDELTNYFVSEGINPHMEEHNLLTASETYRWDMCVSVGDGLCYNKTHFISLQRAGFGNFCHSTCN